MTLPHTSYCEIPLTKGEVAKVSPEDFDELSKWRWTAMPRSGKNGYYAIRMVWIGGRGKKADTIYMHRQILGLEKGNRLQVDHRNLDTLDNRRENIRIVTQSENSLFAHRIRKRNRQCFSQLAQIK